MLQNDFVYKEREGIGYLEAPLLKRTGLVTHAFSTRWGGYSRGPFATLNLGFHVDDDPALVKKNRAVFFRLWHIDDKQITEGNQVHGERIVEVKQPTKGRGPLGEAALPEADGFHTAEPGLALSAFSADCLLIFILDPRRKAIAIVHAGWKGTLLGIAAKAVRKMTVTYGSDPADLLVALSPSIGGCCYEVDESLIARFQMAGYRNLPLVPAKDPSHYYFDLKELNRRQLTVQGVVAESIAVSSWCTCCNDRFFSHRCDKGKSGRMMGFIMLNNRGTRT